MGNSIKVDVNALRDIKSEFTGIPSKINELKPTLNTIKNNLNSDVRSKVLSQFLTASSNLQSAHDKAKKIKNFLDESIQILDGSEKKVKSQLSGLDRTLLSISGIVTSIIGGGKIEGSGTLLLTSSKSLMSQLLLPMSFFTSFIVNPNGLTGDLQTLFKMSSSFIIGDKKNNSLSKETINTIASIASSLSGVAGNINIPKNNSSVSENISYSNTISSMSSGVSSATNSVSKSKIVQNAENLTGGKVEENETISEAIYKEPGLNTIINDPTLHQELINTIKNQFPGISDEDAEALISKMGTAGILTYSSMSGIVINSYENIKGDFQIFNNFANNDGSLNEEGIVMDIYANVNSHMFGENNTFDPTQAQIDIGNWNTNIEKYMHNYFESKGLENVYVESSNILSSNMADSNSIVESESNMIFNEISNQLINNENIIINVKFDNGVTFIDNLNDQEAIYQDNQIHSLYVTNVTEDKITVTSFGHEYNINPKDIANNKYSINVVKIYKENTNGKVYL